MHTWIHTRACRHARHLQIFTFISFVDVNFNRHSSLVEPTTRESIRENYFISNERVSVYQIYIIIMIGTKKSSSTTSFCCILFYFSLSHPAWPNHCFSVILIQAMSFAFGQPMSLHHYLCKRYRGGNGGLFNLIAFTHSLFLLHKLISFACSAPFLSPPRFSLRSANILHVHSRNSIVTVVRLYYLSFYLYSHSLPILFVIYTFWYYAIDGCSGTPVWINFGWFELSDKITLAFCIFLLFPSNARVSLSYTN